MKKSVFKIVSLFLAVSILIGNFVFGVNAIDNVYPESEHDYQNNYSNEWYYKYPENVEGLYITFSEQTSFEEPSWTEVYVEPNEDGEITIGDVMETVEEYKDGDYVSIYNDYYSEYATGKELSGKTLYIPGNSFWVYMETDESITDYGFSIDRISDTPPENIAVVTYEFCSVCGDNIKFCYNPEEDIVVTNSNWYCKEETGAFVCWTSETGEEYYAGDTLDFGSINLKAKRVPLLLDSNEILRFSNSDYYFNVDDKGGYYLSVTDYQMMKHNIYKVFGYGVIPAAALSIALSTYPDWNWQGSCYGMSTTVFLQRYGVINLLEDESYSDCLVDLKNDAKLISAINYYQWSAAGSFFCENFALKPGTEMYSQQLKNLFEAVSNGNIVLFTYYPSGIFEETGHTILMTGAYTQDDGTHVLIAYDCNYPEDYRYGLFEQRFYIDSDYTSIGRGYDYPTEWYDTIGAFNWTDDYSHFEAFDINGEGDASIWYLHFFSQMFELVKTIFTLMF